MSIGWDLPTTWILRGFKMWSAEEQTCLTCFRKSIHSKRSLPSWGRYLVRILQFTFLVIYFRMLTGIDTSCLGTASEKVGEFYWWHRRLLANSTRVLLRIWWPYNYDEDEYLTWLDDSSGTKDKHQHFLALISAISFGADHICTSFPDATIYFWGRSVNLTTMGGCSPLLTLLVCDMTPVVVEWKLSDVS